MKNSRQIIFEVLSKVFSDNSYSTISLDNALQEVTDSQEKAFISRIVYGVIERKITLDYITESKLNKPYSKVKPKVKVLLRMGVYQLYFCDKIPSRAAINETVEIAKGNGLEFYKGFINAVLHSVDKERIDINNQILSVKYSCPENLINMWTKQYGEENVLPMLEAINEKPPLFATANSLYVDNDELVYELNSEEIEAEICDSSVQILSSVDIKNLKSFKNGLFHIQDMSSRNCTLTLGAKAGDTVFDICAAPGGKSFSLAEDMKNEGKIYSFDLYESRLNLVNDGAKRLGIDIIEAMVNDGLKFNEEPPKADKILCDVPCSGFGIIRRKPEIRYKELDSIKDLPEIQYNILLTSSKYLKDGGKIMYSTCTLNKKENENVVNKFLDENSQFKLAKTKTVFPSKNGGDGFFYALFERN